MFCNNNSDILNDECNEYLNIVNEIEKNITTKNYKCLINFKVNDLIEYNNICTYSIYQIGSICCLSAWICNVPGIQFGRKSIKIYEKIDKNIKENPPNIKYLVDNINFYDNCYEISSDTIVNMLPNFFNTCIYNKYKNNIDYKEKIYMDDLNIDDIVKKLEKNNSKILICNGDYNESSGGITVLHYFCHLLNYVAKKNIAYIVRVVWLPNGTFKKIDDYDSSDYILKTHTNYLTPCVTPEILLNRNNIVVYMDSIIGNPLEQKYVVRWVLYFELSMRIKTWNENDLIIWFIDTYQKYSKYVQKINNEEPINYQEIPNKQIVMPIISNINKILAFGENNENNIKNGICFTTRKSGNNINPDRRLRNIDIIGERCENCQKNIWPCVCNCENYTNGVKLLHSKENIVYRFEYPINLNDEIDIFAKTEKFYMYDPFCFSAVLAGLKNCLTIVPKLDSFEDDNPYENVPWMKYGISYGTDEESIIEAQNTLPFAKEKLTNVFYDLNYNSLEIFFNAINDLF